ncbi:protein kinase [Planctomycetota bacterium]
MSKIRIFGVKFKQVAQLLSVAEEQIDHSNPTEQHSSNGGKSVSDHKLNSEKQDTQTQGFPLPVTSTDISLEKPGSWIGRYKLLSMLGEGGMGIVYLAEQHDPFRRQVALKIIKPGMDSKRIIARFEAEQQTLALLEHSYIARIHDAGLTQTGRSYFVMEYVKGIFVTEYCDKYKLTIEERLQLFLHICEAIQHAHQKGIIHRDIKPSNILVTGSGIEAIPKVIDFGVARALSLPLSERTLYTEQGQLVGTPEYMSPEQVDIVNQDIDTRTDVYSLGALLYELLTGVLPFDLQTFREGGVEHMRKVICEQDPKTPSTRLRKTSIEGSKEIALKRQSQLRTLQHKLRGDLDWITLKAIEKNRARRYASVDAMSKDIQSFLNDQPVSAAPPDAIYQAKKFIRRHRQAVIILLMIAVILFGSIFSIIMYRQAAKEELYAESLEHQRLLAIAQELISNRKLEEALTNLDQLLDSPHVNRRARLIHAQLLIEQKNLITAVSELESLLDKSDDIAGQAHFLLAGIYYETDPWAPGKTQQYVTKWKNHSSHAEKLIAGTSQYYFLQAKSENDVKTKLKLLTKALNLDKEHYESLRERAYIHYAQKDYRNMSKDAARMIGLQSRNPAGYLLSALVAREQEQYKEAIADHNEAIILAPDDPELYEQRRETYMRMGHYSLALADAQQASTLDPENLSHHVRVFMILVALGQFEQAQQQYERVISEPWAQTEYSPWAWATGSWNTKNWFCYLTRKYTSDALSHNQIYPFSIKKSKHIALQAMYEAANYYKRLSTRAKRIVTDGFTACWSPDGMKIAHTQGAFMASAIAILDLKTGTTELLTMPGKDPIWSPNGKYIAYVRDRQSLSLAAFAKTPDAMERHRKSGRPNYMPRSEVWVIEFATRKIRHIDVGQWPAWSRDSRQLYYRSYTKGTLCSISIEEDQPIPNKVLAKSGPFPIFSPSEKYVANAKFRQLDILNVQSQKPTITWISPPFPCKGLLFQWRPDENEIAVGGWHGTRMGLWILNTQTGKTNRMIDGPVTTACWSPDCSKMTIALGHPYWEIWLADLDPNQPTVEAFGDARTEEQHCRELIERCNRYIEIDPNYIDDHLCRTDTALWIQDKRTTEYLEDLERVFRCTPYHADGCNQRAKAILSSSKELRDRLLPLALLLARKAVEKEPENAGFLRTLGEALCHTEDREHAEAILLRAFDLSIAASDPHDPKASEVIQLLIDLYEAWNKPEEAKEWRAKLPQTEAVKE